MSEVVIDEKQKAAIEAKRVAALERRKTREQSKAQKRETPEQHEEQPPEKRLKETEETTIIEAAAAVATPISTISPNPNGDLAFFPAGDWRNALEPEFSKPYFKELMKFVNEERQNKTIYPPREDVFNAFRLTPLENVKVVIIGQDPYINQGEAHGLCFSVRKGIKIPPSLNRIYNVLQKTIPGFKKPKHGCLEEWAKQGVFLLNASLTVEKGKSNSHAKAGWQQFTDSVISILNKAKPGIIYMLWGLFAQKKASIVNRSVNHVMECAHPSPMSGSGFNDCDHFAKANEILVKEKKQPINWNITN